MVQNAPPNIQEFNVMSGLVFAQLYRAFPAVINIDKEAIAKSMGIEGPERALESGRTFREALAQTIA